MSFLLGRLRFVQSGVLLAVVILFVIFTFWTVASAWQGRANSILDNFRTSDREITTEFFTNLEQLNAIPDLQPCSDEMLKMMRITEYSSKYWHEYAYVADGLLLCSTSLGVLDQPIAEPAADIINREFSFTRNAPVPLLDGSVTAMQMWKGHFRALLRPFINPTDTTSWLSFGTFSLAGGSVQHIYGDASFPPAIILVNEESSFQQVDNYSKLSQDELLIQWYEHGSWVVQLCIRQESCAVVSIDVLGFFAEETEISIAILVCFVALLLLSSVLTPLLYQRYFSLNRQLNRGLKRGRVICHYQPIIPISPIDPVGCEVLCRWLDESGNLIYPDQFIPEIERNGQSGLLTEVVFVTAIQELDDAEMLGRINFSINAFPEDIESGLLLRLIDQFLPGQYCNTLTIELTEKEINNMNLLRSGVQALRALGVKISIDDFGTGYSNLNHLKQLQVDSIKIDKSFIWGLGEGMVHAGLVQNIVYIGECLNLYCVAEGVETKAQLNMLRELDVQYIQGYYFSRPKPITGFVEYLSRDAECGNYKIKYITA
ncbi:EAL domain-containing protein [Amphritea balenae]|uniref:cyclic-guanylate-specific phosphodiesterase n=1 Tax=Amphritea balenae TaxID=452629 RepID=A0A3P1SVD4_9GAMM|nr:EAL domain-containing protein [Amphritea balenae]RRD01121.1 EAL domain-containing protein [Amphritea balenae]GGK59736.1 hypothetical protein GCM10007941_07500 [Amphritea balenae]